MSTLDALIVEINDHLWTYLLIPLVAIAGLWFTIRSKAVQLRLLPEMLRVLKTPAQNTGTGRRSVSAFGAFTISAAARIGTGNVAGVAAAITLGGPGAVFWMWVMALVGGASSFVESTLAQLYKVRNTHPGGEGTYRGGPAYYMQRGLGKRWLGVTFAVIITLTFGWVFTAVQSNTITTVLKSSGSSDASSFTFVVGMALAGLLALSVFGGVKRIAHITQVLVPVMAVLYLLMGLLVLALNFGELPSVLASIVEGAFGLREAASGAIGAAIMQGVRRGMFSNEAGLGSAPNAAATAEVSHPVKQGLVQTLGVYFDTLIVCSMTAFIILSTNPSLSERGGADLTQSALEETLGGWAGYVLAVVVFMLAFSSMIGNYYYGESNVRFVTGSKPVMAGYRVVILACTVLGAMGSVSVVWSLADVTMGAMALVNLLAVLPLSVIAFRLLEDYVAQRRAGLDPVFTRDRVPGLKGVECWEPAGGTSGPQAGGDADPSAAQDVRVG
ncbi:alanine:cation symporter family protein [Streptomyces sp. RKND-216]|uniref:alanine/glycine:cation symporter family protein n=1 Tax=Streptomyces sp. RKND-216 TaxID=2562581 RepID=UPI00109D98DF|nr:alanine/glycine:cation symporter family protein [Streptomyces sp. RKND-216]THA25817.1 alanine:cation symporter family protein [Streptomyces sp. RKND-216]